MSSPPASPLLPELHLDNALQLQQSGRELPEPRRPGLAAGGGRRAVRTVQPRRAHRPGESAPVRDRAGARDRPRGARGRAGAAADDRHRPLQARQRHHGHPAGDCVLQAIAACLLECVRPMDTLARIGGEEFAIILPNCAPTFGRTVAERIRHKVEQRSIAIDEGRRTIAVTIASAARSRRSGCARPRRCGWHAPTSSSTAPCRGAQLGLPRAGARGRGQRREEPALQHHTAGQPG